MILQMHPIDRENILGVHIGAINMTQTLDTIDYWIAHKQQNYVCVTPAHGVMDCYRKPELRTIFNNSGLTTPDGMSIVWLLQLAGHRHVRRVYGPDLMLTVCKHSQEMGYKHYLYGGNLNVADKLAEKLQARFPALQIVGTHSPPFRPLTDEEDAATVEMINAAQPDIVWIGLSTPKQEQWMASHLHRIEAPVMIGVGAAFDFLSGRKKQAPRWIQKIGLEWAFRLSTEPKRLWRRYSKYPLFSVLVISQLMGIKKYP